MRSKNFIKSLIIILFFPFALFAQAYVFFNDSPNNTYYDPSFGYYNSPSVIVLANGDKFPVDVDNKYSGTNALRLRWKSVSGGDWGIAVAEQGWIAHDVTVKDSITFWVFTFAAIDSASLPVIYIEDLQNRKTPKQKLSDFVNGIEEDKWIKISVPLDPFIQSPGNVDLTQIKTIYFGQDNPDGVLHTIYLDEIRMISIDDIDTTAPDIPTGLSATGYHSYILLKWSSNSETDLAGYRIYREDNNEYQIVGTAAANVSSYSNNTGIPPKTYSYKISAYDLSGNESDLSSEVTASTTSASDEALLDTVEQATFKYFWDYAHPVSGLTRERLGSGETVTTGGSGFGVMAIIVGADRGYITRDEAVARMLKILDFLINKADRFHGAFPHWMNGTTGNVIPFSNQYDDGGDLVETAYMVQGLLTARQYFNQNNTDEEQIRNMISAIWEDVEWDWYRKDNGNFIYWHWSPNYDWIMNFPLQGPNETMITYLLAIASPTHPIPASLYHSGWASSSNYVNGNSYYGIPLYVGWAYGGPLFFAHYSFLGFDPRYKKDDYTNYFINNRNHTLINRAYCIDNPHNFPGYDENTWGLTASDDPFGYLAHEPDFNGNRDNGTISPTAAISSMPYTPQESINALKSFFYIYGGDLWGAYGFKDAFNLKQNWYAQSYLAIDQGPIIIMIENYRTQLLWNNFMTNPEIQPMLDAIGFVPDTTTGIKDEVDTPYGYELKNNYPNPFNPITNIEFQVSDSGPVTLRVYDVLGNEVRTLVNEEKIPGYYKVRFDGENLSSGIYFYVLQAGDKTFSKKMCLLK